MCELLSEPVNYYNHHIGDYIKDTGELTLTQHGAYRLLLDRAYATEKPLPTDRQQLYNICRAKTKTEREAVDYVARTFFQNGVSKRVQEELAKAYEEISENQARKDNEKERQRRHRERRKSLFDQLRAYGEVPKWDAPTEDLETLLKTCLKRDRNAPVTSQATAIHDSNNQPPTTNGDGVDVSGISKAVELPVDKKIEKTPEALRALQNPAWLMNFDHAKLHARKLGINPAGKTHQELKDAILERSGAAGHQQHQPKFAQSQ